MSGTTLDVLAIGDAVVDVIAVADDAFLEREGLVKGLGLLEPRIGTAALGVSPRGDGAELPAERFLIAEAR